MRVAALLGDSTLDNAPYVGGEPDVIAALTRLLPVGYDAALLAVDGNVIADIAAQLAKAPSKNDAHRPERRRQWAAAFVSVSPTTGAFAPRTRFISLPASRPRTYRRDRRESWRSGSSA